MTDLAMELTNTRVRKWGRLKLGLSLYGASGITVPDTAAELFDATTHKPKPFPTGVRELGYITTAGVTDTKSVSSTNTTMLQSIFPVRTDFEGIEKSMAAVFGESNAWTNALYHGAKWDTWPTDKDAAWLYSDGDDSAFDADYVLWLQGVDGVGTQAIYRAEVGHRVRITSIESRTMNRSDAEGFGFTFALLRDDVTGLVHTRGEDGPGYATHLTVTP